MIQDTLNSKKFTASEGKVFKRIHDGFQSIENGIVLGDTIILGEILVNSFGEKLETPIEDKIEYYTEIDKPEQKPHDDRNVQFMAANEPLD